MSLYYMVGRVGGPADIYVVTRDSFEDPWNEPQKLGINTRHDEASPALSPDGQEIYVSDGQMPRFSADPRPGGMGSVDIWSSSWDPESGAWREPQNVEAVNTRHGDYGPNLSTDGLELYFASERPGGLGASDIWMARRPTSNDPWGEPMSLGPVVNSTGDDQFPAISPDGRMLIFGSNRPGTSGSSNLWLSARDRVGGDWGPPVHLGTVLNNDYWATEPDFSYDGTVLYFGKLEAGLDDENWKVALLPLEGAPVTVGDEYVQDFDSLSSNTAAGSMLPTGWTASNSGVVFENSTTQDFPPQRAIRPGSVFNAGEDEHQDRALAVGATRGTSRNPSQAPMLQFLSELDGADVAALQPQFDLEAWDAERRADAHGVAAFDVSMEVDSGDGFYELRDVGIVTTSELSLPEGDYLNGNLDKNRFVFDSGAQSAMIPFGSTLRVRWELPALSQSGDWVFGLDNVRLHLFGSLIDAFDCNGDVTLDVLDANCSSAPSLDGTLSAANLIKGDADGDGQV